MGVKHVRIDQLRIKNWKNVQKGEINLTDSKDRWNLKPRVLGIYGQNGSGKTTVIQVLNILKTLMMGRSLSNKVFDFISTQSDTSELEVVLSITDHKEEMIKVKYYVEFIKIYEKEVNTDLKFDLTNNQSKKTRVGVSKEILSVSYQTKDKKQKMTEIINMDQFDNEIFAPRTKLKMLSGDDKEALNELLICKKMSFESSRSFIFNNKTLDIIREKCNDNFYRSIFDYLVNYANYNLFIIGNEENGLINLNIALPFNFKLQDKSNHHFLGTIAIDLQKTSSIPKDVYDIVKKSICHLNKVLVQLIPNLKIEIEQVGEEIDEKGNAFVKVQLYSERNNIKVSLINESEGIKKIVSILQLLIVMFNNPSTTVAIDELDSGIFEYLLGELVRIISQSAQGQLIFTSHNLRPLETIDKKYVCFTTINSENRYVKMANVARNNNLRNFYFHELLLGGQKEELYEQTNNGAITLAFKEAGGYIE